MKGKNIFLKKKVIGSIVGGVIILILALLPFYGQSILKEPFSSEDKGKPLTLRDLKQKDDLKNVAGAVVGLPWQFGGTVIKYQPMCTVDNQSGTCPSSCPMCTQMVGQACSSYQEIQYTPVLGSMPSSPPGTVCAKQGFQFMGGAPMSGADILGGGASPQLPWVIGVVF